MNYKEIKSKIQSLGFEETETMTEYAESVANAVDQAVRFINATVMPIVKVRHIEQDGTAQSPVVYDMAAITGFLDFYEKPKTTVSGARKTFNDFSIEGRDKIVIRGDYSGEIDVYYKASHTKITKDTPDAAEIELPLIVHPLIPLLASHYIWLDDDERKATFYWNEYDDLKNQIMQNKEQPVTVSFEGGIKFGGEAKWGG